MPRAFVASLIIVLLGLILWWSQDSDEPVIRPTSDRTVLDAFMNSFTMKAMDESGNIALILSADSLKHYSNTKLSELEQPRISMLDQAQQWHIQSRSGLIDKRKQHVKLQDDVIIKRVDDPAGEFTITTDLLEIDITKQIASTDSTVTMINQDIELRSKGLLLDNQSGKLNLLADVKSIVNAD